jgi:hypothetical protein
MGEITIKNTVRKELPEYIETVESLEVRKI